MRPLPQTPRIQRAYPGAAPGGTANIATRPAAPPSDPAPTALCARSAARVPNPSRCGHSLGRWGSSCRAHRLLIIGTNVVAPLRRRHRLHAPLNPLDAVKTRALVSARYERDIIGVAEVCAGISADIHSISCLLFDHAGLRSLEGMVDQHGVAFVIISHCFCGTVAECGALVTRSRPYGSMNNITYRSSKRSYWSLGSALASLFSTSLWQFAQRATRLSAWFAFFSSKPSSLSKLIRGII